LITLNDDYITEWMPFHLYQQWAQQGQGTSFRFIHQDSWPLQPGVAIEAGIKDLGGEEVARFSRRSGLVSVLVRLSDGSLVVLRDWRNQVLVDIATGDRALIEQITEKLKTTLPTVKVRRDDKARVIVNFMTVKQYFTRTLDAAKWSGVAQNYPTRVRSQLEPFLAPEFRPSSSGQLMLWHGLPGTGKTWALRALGYEWRKWAEMIYIVDPDQFFGDSVYMMNTLMQGGGGISFEDDEDLDEEKRVPAKDRWRLLVAEDTGELLSADAKTRTGQGLSRLLNIVDGMIGQGLRVLVLITTNETIGALHPAVTRPGRAAGIIEFEAFPANEANDWLRANNRQERRSQKPITLAELYNHKEQAPDRKVGFAA
jgi:hypothetical protein